MVSTPSPCKDGIYSGRFGNSSCLLICGEMTADQINPGKGTVGNSTGRDPPVLGDPSGTGTPSQEREPPSRVRGSGAAETAPPAAPPFHSEGLGPRAPRLQGVPASDPLTGTRILAPVCFLHKGENGHCCYGFPFVPLVSRPFSTTRIPGLSSAFGGVGEGGG